MKQLTRISHTEFAGTLLGFDDYVNMVLEDVIELYVSFPSISLPTFPPFLDAPFLPTIIPRCD